MIKKSFFTSVFLLFTSALIFSEKPLRSVDLNKLQPSWQAVIGGVSVAPVSETTYGFAVVSDGRMVSTCTSKGNVIWQKSVKGKPSRYFSSWGDFLYVCTGKSTLNLINPSGVCVWSKDTGFKITASPLTGRDGRIFVQGENKIACFGIEGRKKWTLNTPQLNELPVCELNDGSLLVFISQAKNGKTKGLRFTAFGEALEEITFAGKILCAKSCENGVLMSFHDGSFGLCVVEQNTAISKWVMHESRATNGIRGILPSGDKSSLLYSTGGHLQVLVISNASGKLLNSFDAGSFAMSDLRFARSTFQGFFAADSNRALEFGTDGTIFWEASLPSSKKWNYITYTSGNQLLLCMNDWVLNSYMMNQSVGKKSKPKTQKQTSYVSKSNLNIKYDGITYTSTPVSRIEEIKKCLSTENCGTKEAQMLSELKEQTGNYLDELYNNAKSAREKNAWYSVNPVYTETVLTAVSQSQTDIFVSDIAAILRLETDPIMLNSLLRCTANIKYDKDGQILSALEEIAQNRISKKDVSTAKLICDSIYSIVGFMGRPALYRQGKAILTHFMYPQYDKQIRDYASLTLKKIIELEL